MIRRKLLAVPLRVVIWLFPLVFMIHDLEELLLIESWQENNKDMLAAKLQLLGIDMNGIIWTTPSFAAAVTVLFFLICAVCYRAAKPGATAKAGQTFVVFISVLFLNVFTHAAQSVIIGQYTPGVVSAVVIVLPYTLFAFYYLLQQSRISPDTVRWLVIAAVVILAASFCIRLLS